MRSLLQRSQALAILLLACASATAQVPRTISFQGVLANADGSLIPDGNHILVLKLYESASGGGAIYTEEHTVPVVKGIFNVIIGSNTPIPSNVAFDRAYFLGVSVDRAAELAPRTALTTAPYALRAAVANDLAPGASVVRSVNTRSGAVTLVGSGATSITQAGNTITIHSTGTGGSGGIQGIQSVDGTIDVTAPNGPVTTLSLADNAVTGAKIAAGAVTEDKIANDAITADKIATDAVTADEIAAGAVLSPKLAVNAVRTVNVADSSITQAKLAAGLRFPPSGPAGGALTGTYPNPDLGSEAVKNGHLATDAVTGSKILDGSITGSDIAATAALSVATVAATGSAAFGTTLGPARLLVRGSGTTTNTIAFDVGNSTGTTMFRVRDNGAVGINIAAPTADLDVAGLNPVAIQARAGTLVLSTMAVVAAPVVTLPPVMSVQITNDGVALPFAIVFPPGIPGQTMIVTNDDPDPVIGPFAIASGQSRLFTMVAGAWRLVN